MDQGAGEALGPPGRNKLVESLFSAAVLPLMTSTIKNPGGTFESLLLLETSFSFLNERCKPPWHRFQKATGEGESWEDSADVGEPGPHTGWVINQRGGGCIWPREWGVSYLLWSIKSFLAGVTNRLVVEVLLLQCANCLLNDTL